MCNRFGYLAPISRLQEEFSQLRLPLLFKNGAIPNLEPREHIRPTDPAGSRNLRIECSSLFGRRPGDKTQHRTGGGHNIRFW